jgi:small-conductance mechanosensitive channel
MGTPGLPLRARLWRKLRVALLSLLWLGSAFLLMVGCVTVLVLIPTNSPSVSAEADQESAGKERSWWARPAALELADTAKTKGEVREEQLGQRLRLAAEAEPQPTRVDQSSGVTVVKVGDSIVATVLPEDLPEYAPRLEKAAHKKLELEVGEAWARRIDNHLNELRYRDNPAYGYGVSIIFVLMAALGYCLHRVLSLWGRVFLDSPLWTVKASLWAVLAFIAFQMLPGGESIGYILERGVADPLFSFLVASLVGSTLGRTGNYALRRYFNTLGQTKRYRNQARAHARLLILRHALQFGLRLLTGLIVVVLFLYNIDVNLSTLVTGAGLLGASITFVCQDIIRDFLAGVNILMEDEFVLGDQIEGAGASGKVERFTLRSTHLRCSDGSLMSVPNQELRKVRNFTKDWSQVDFRLSVSKGQALAPALEALTEELAGLASDCEDKLLSEPELLGAEELGPCVVLRATVRTEPGQQWTVKRELNRRVKQRFERDGIELA